MPAFGRMKFFIDNCLSPMLAEGMRGFGEQVVHLKDCFPQDTDDCIWLEYVGRNQYILITRDEKIRKNPAEINAFRQYYVGAFLLGGKNRSKCQIIQQIVRNWPRLKEFDHKTKRPYAFRVPPSGTKFVRIV